MFISNCAGIVTHASGPVTVGQTVTDTATLSNVTATAGGTITFKLYSAATCSAASEVFTSTVNVNGPNDYTSGAYTTTAPGTLYWIATYTATPTTRASREQWRRE